MWYIKIKSKIFVNVFIFIVILTPIILFTLNWLDLPYTDNDLIRHYQLAKLNQKSEIETIIVGDSSAGNAINAKYFEELSGKKTLNLALSGSFGLEGSFNMIRHALAQNKTLKNVIIIQSLDSWERSPKSQAFFESLGNLDIPSANHPLFYPWMDTYRNYLSFLINPQEVYWFSKYLIVRQTEIGISQENDYFMQVGEKFSNGRKELISNTELSRTINRDRESLLQVIDDFCYTEKLNCIYVHGPIHLEVYENSKEIIEDINSSIGEMRKMNVIRTIFHYDNDKMGDTIDHIDPKYKNETTEDYFKAIKDFLFIPLEPVEEAGGERRVVEFNGEASFIA